MMEMAVSVWQDGQGGERRGEGREDRMSLCLDDAKKMLREKFT